MTSLSNIPEPTAGYRPDNDQAAKQMPLQGLAVKQSEETVASPRSQVEDEDQPQQQIDSMSCLLILLIAGGLLRLVLGFFGPLQATNPKAWQTLIDRGRLAMTDHPLDAFPLPGLVASALSSVGLPSWVFVAIGSLLTLAATPAAYVIGRATTGRRAAGILAAALVTVHPAVLAASNTLSGTAIAMSLITIGLALALHSSKRGYGFAIGGGMTLGLATLSAPLLWIPAVLAAPFVAQLNLYRGAASALGHALTVLVIALGPMVAYRLASIDLSLDAVLIEFNETAFVGSHLHPGDRLLITLTDPSLAELGQALQLPVGDAGQLASNTISVETHQPGRPDIVADVLADGWLMMNAALASLATVSIGVLLARRRYIETALLAAPLIALAFAHVPPGEALRLPMIALLGVLAAGLLANRAVVQIDEARLAERKARKASKRAAKEEKQRSKQERNAQQDKDALFAFDQPKRNAKKRQKQQSEADDDPPAGVLTARTAESSEIPARPI